MGSSFGKCASDQLKECDVAAYYLGETTLETSDWSSTSYIELKAADVKPYKAKYRDLKFYQVYRGEMKLSIVHNDGNLTVHVQEARHLRACDTFVKVAIVPCSSKKTTCFSSIRMNTDQPVYEEKFTYELLDHDYRKKVQISVYQHDNMTKTNNFIGSMSFGIRNLVKQKKNVSGWFYLFVEQLGACKHMKVTDDTNAVVSHHSRQRQNSTGSSTCNSVSSTCNSVSSTGDNIQITTDPINRPVATNSPIQVITVPVVNKKCKGYGLSLTKGYPTKISGIQFGSPADISGLRIGDQIIRINGQPVHDMSALTVGRVIKHYPKSIVLDVLRSESCSNSHLMENEYDLSNIQKPGPLGYIQFDGHPDVIDSVWAKRKDNVSKPSQRVEPYIVHSRSSDSNCNSTSF